MFACPKEYGTDRTVRPKMEKTRFATRRRVTAGEISGPISCILAGVNFCPDCGGRLAPDTVDGEPRSFRVCGHCRSRHYDHPSIMLTCFVSRGQKLLWIQRKLEPKRGFWAIPGGFMESGETTAEGAARELREETGIRLDPAGLEFYMTGTITFINQVYIAYRARVAATEECAPGREALAAAFYSRDECPWDQVAYPEVNDSIRRAYDDLEQGRFGIYQAEMSEDLYRLRPVVATDLRSIDAAPRRHRPGSPPDSG